jgi:hypothetical protein
MASIIFNLSARTYRTFQKELDGATYTFTIRYLKRTDSWLLDISDIVKGINIVGGLNLLAPFYYLNVPPGQLVLKDFDNLLRDPTQETFPSRMTLEYIEVV